MSLEQNEERLARPNFLCGDDEQEKSIKGRVSFEVYNRRGEEEEKGRVRVK